MIIFPHSPAVIASSKTYTGWDRTAYMDTTTHFTGPSWHKSPTDSGCCFRVPAWRRGIDFLPVLLPQVIYSFNLIGVQELWGSYVYWDMCYVLLLPSYSDSHWPGVSCLHCWQSTFDHRGIMWQRGSANDKERKKALLGHSNEIMKLNLHTQLCFSVCVKCVIFFSVHQQDWCINVVQYLVYHVKYLPNETFCVWKPSFCSSCFLFCLLLVCWRRRKHPVKFDIDGNASSRALKIKTHLQPDVWNPWRHFTVVHMVLANP